MPNSKSRGPADRKRASQARLPADREQREVDGESRDSRGELSRRWDVEDGGELGTIAAGFRLVKPKIRITARGQGVIAAEKLITAGSVLAAAYVATLDHGQIPGLAAMAALTILAIAQLFRNSATTGTKRRPADFPYRHPKYLGGRSPREKSYYSNEENMKHSELHPAPRAWRKSSFSGNSGCVEVATSDGEILVRDSKDPFGPILRFTIHEWICFVNGIHSGEFSPQQLENSDG